MNANKIGAVLAHIVACGTFLAASFLSSIELLQSAIFAEAMAIYFNTSKK